MPSARGRRSLAAAAALALALAACGREAPLEDRVQQRLEAKDFDGALAILDRQAAKTPGDVAAKVLRVRALLVAGRMDQALEGYAALPEASIAQDPRLARQVALTLVWSAFRSRDTYLESRGAMALAALGDAEAMPLFREALAHANPSVRALALRGLGRVKGPEAEALAQGALRDQDGGVRAVAAEALGVLGARGAGEVLRAALKDREPAVRLRAAVALALLGDAQGEEILRRTLQARGEATPRDPFDHIVAAEALARLGDPAARALLVDLLENPRDAVALFAAEALSNLGDQAPRAFLQKAAQAAPDRENRMWATWTLARLGDGAGAPGLTEMLADKDEHLRLKAAWTLGQMGRLAPLEPLRKALADSNLVVRYQAAWSLGEIVLSAAPPPRPGEG
jgi:HEAT repeat protein